MWLTPVDVCIQIICPRSGKLLDSRRMNSTCIAYCLSEDDKRVLVVGEKKQEREYRLDGGVRTITRFASQGKATLQIVRRNITLLLSGADPDALSAWCSALLHGSGAPHKASMIAPSAQRQRQELDAFAKRPLSSRSPGLANASPGHYGSPALSKKVRPRTAPSPLQLSPAAREALTDEQQRVLEAALSGKSLFFTGGAGTGKSFLLRSILQRMPKETTFATASTGVAACQVGGVTVHHWAGIGSAERSVAELAAMASRKRGAQWQAARCLIIDEVSMLDGDVFDKLEAVARRVRNNQRPFGGLQLILSGDFFQLPPVSPGGHFKFAFEAESWARCVPLSVELTRVFRQRDPQFVAALNEVRLGVCSDATRRLLRGCIGRRLDGGGGGGGGDGAGGEGGIGATRLFTHLRECERLNEAKLAELPGEPLVFRARDTARDDAALAQLRASCGAPAELRLKHSAQVLLTKTLDASQGLVNGARGVVVKFLARTNPVVRFDGGAELVIRPESFTISQGGAVVAARSQLPLAHGWALSIHKSQGMTLERVQLSLGRVFECGQMYVALSRCTSLEGLSLTDIDFTRLQAHPKALAFARQMQQQA